MAYAMMFPEGAKGGRGNKLSRNQDSLTPTNKTEKNNIANTRFILKHDSECAKLVRDGHPDYPLLKTYEAVKQAVEDRAKKAEEERQKLEKLMALRGEYPDLAALMKGGFIWTKRLRLPFIARVNPRKKPSGWLVNRRKENG